MNVFEIISLNEAKGVAELVKVGKDFMVAYPGDAADPTNTTVFDNKADAKKAVKLWNRKGVKTQGISSFDDYRKAWRNAEGFDKVSGKDVKVKFQSNYIRAFKWIGRISSVLAMASMWTSHVEMQADLFVDYKGGLFGTKQPEAYKRYNHASNALAGIFVGQLAAQFILAVKGGATLRKILSTIRLAAAGAATSVVGAIPALLTWLATEAAVQVAVWWLSDRENAEDLLAWMYEDGWEEAMNTPWGTANIAGNISLGIANVARQTNMSNNLKQAVGMDPATDEVESNVEKIYGKKSQTNPPPGKTAVDRMTNKAAETW